MLLIVSALVTTSVPEREYVPGLRRSVDPGDAEFTAAWRSSVGFRMVWADKTKAAQNRNDGSTSHFMVCYQPWSGE